MDDDQNLAGYNYRTTALAAGASYTVTTVHPTMHRVTTLIKADGHGATGSRHNTDGGSLAKETKRTTQALALTLPRRI